MSALENQFGAPTSLAGFERKAQRLNYVSVYRAVFEGFQARSWTQNSGRPLWMAHPAWPSNHWQIYSSDYDTQASHQAYSFVCRSRWMLSAKSSSACRPENRWTIRFSAAVFTVALTATPARFRVTLTGSGALTRAGQSSSW